MVFNVCVKFHENMSNSFKVMERTRKLLTDTDTHTHTHTHTHTERERKDENIIPPWYTSYAGGINKKILVEREITGAFYTTISYFFLGCVQSCIET